jgi:hypothetical protein
MQRGTLHTRLTLDPAEHYDIYVSTTGGDPAVPSASKLTELEPVGARRWRPAGSEVAVRNISKLIARLRGQLPW